MAKVLMLNATYEPLCVIPLRRAVVLILEDKAELVAAADGELRSASLSVPVPTVVRLRRYVRVPYRATLALTRNALFARDRHRCQYCGDPASTIDHVHPRARGGEHRWENVVAACGPCNNRKGDRTLAELGWTLARPPKAPVGLRWLIVGVANLDPAWEQFLEPTAPVAAPA